jgi:multidrug resistance protein, MATE family
MFTFIQNRWLGRGGYREMLVTAFPLILCTASWSLLQFIDRMFLTWYSADAVAAAMPGGALNAALICPFAGLAGYAGTFISQYHGGGAWKKVGPILWQGIYLSIASGIIVMALIPAGSHVFAIIGHQEPVRSMEKAFFRYTTIAAVPVIVNSTLS